MFYRVEAIDINSPIHGKAPLQPCLIKDVDIAKAEQLRGPTHGHEKVVRVYLDAFGTVGAHMLCVGTIDTFATPWEPGKKIHTRTACENSAWRAAEKLDAARLLPGRPDEEPDADIRDDALWLRRVGECLRDGTLRQSCWTHVVAIADRLERSCSPSAPDWHSVDEPPEDGTWCWVWCGDAMFLAKRFGSGWCPCRLGQIVEDKLAGIGGVTHWQPANVPEPPDGEETNVHS